MLQFPKTPFPHPSMMLTEPTDDHRLDCSLLREDCLILLHRWLIRWVCWCCRRCHCHIRWRYCMILWWRWGLLRLCCHIRNDVVIDLGVVRSWHRIHIRSKIEWYRARSRIWTRFLLVLGWLVILKRGSKAFTIVFENNMNHEFPL